MSSGRKTRSRVKAKDLEDSSQTTISQYFPQESGQLKDKKQSKKIREVDKKSPSLRPDKKQPVSSSESESQEVKASSAAEGERSDTKGESTAGQGEGSGTKGESTAAEGEGSGTKGESTAAEGEGFGTKGESIAAEGEGSGTKGESIAAQGEGSGTKGESTAAEGEGSGTKGESIAAEGEGSGTKGESTAQEEVQAKEVNIKKIRPAPRRKEHSVSSSESESESQEVNKAASAAEEAGSDKKRERKAEKSNEGTREEMGSFLTKKAKNNQSSDSDTDMYISDDGDAGGFPTQAPDRNERKKKGGQPALRKKWSDLDTQEYRDGYPNKKDDPNLFQNLKFYQNKIPSDPEGDFVDEIHRNWRGDYNLLESHHGYIQWLFPIRECGMNYHAQELQLHEAKAIVEDKEAHLRVLESYKLMLDFYGMVLKDEESGEVCRAEHHRIRLHHLNRSYHNYLRITRILKSLGELNYEHLKAPFVEFVIKEAFQHHTLDNAARSCTDYWVQTIREEEDRKRLIKLAEKLEKEHKKTSY